MDITKNELEQFLLYEITTVKIRNLNEPKFTNSKLFELLWQIILENKHPLAWRASWTLYHLASNNTKGIRPYLDQIIEMLPQFTIDGQKRELLKVLMLFEVSELDMGKLVNICYDFLLSSNESLATRVHAMQLLFNISEKEPELKPELKKTIEFVMLESQAGMKSRGRKLLKMMKDIE